MNDRIAIPQTTQVDIDVVFKELDQIQLEFFRRLSPAQKGRNLANLVAAMRQMALTSERHMHPDLPEAEIKLRAAMRFMRMSEWEDREERERVIAYLRRVYGCEAKSDG